MVCTKIIQRFRGKVGEYLDWMISQPVLTVGT